ncbi:MAG: hypothetical protein AB7P97_21535 [Hyphomonadaceae bacterium]
MIEMNVRTSQNFAAKITGRFVPFDNCSTVNVTLQMSTSTYFVFMLLTGVVFQPFFLLLGVLFPILLSPRSGLFGVFAFDRSFFRETDLSGNRFPTAFCYLSFAFFALAPDPRLVAAFVKRGSELIGRLFDTAKRANLYQRLSDIIESNAARHLRTLGQESFMLYHSAARNAVRAIQDLCDTLTANMKVRNGLDNLTTTTPLLGLQVFHIQEFNTCRDHT